MGLTLHQGDFSDAVLGFQLLNDQHGSEPIDDAEKGDVVQVDDVGHGVSCWVLTKTHGPRGWALHRERPVSSVP